MKVEEVEMQKKVKEMVVEEEKAEVKGVEEILKEEMEWKRRRRRRRKKKRWSWKRRRRWWSR